MIEIENLSFKYKNGKQILNDINFTIRDGEVISIIGNNGVGKSTFLKIISGILKPTKGNVKIDNIDAYQRKNMELIRKKVGIVFQNPDNQILFNNVYNDVDFALKNLNLDNSDKRVKEALNMVGMAEHINENTFKLSLGQKQRVNIASCLAIQPKYLMLDEPTTMIDSYGKLQIYDIIKKLKENNQTIVFITNNINEILFSDRIMVLEEGKIKQVFSKEEIFDDISLLEKNNIYIPDFLRLIILLNRSGLNIKIKDYSVEELSNSILKEIRK
ncbi:MAG: ATP-binding cassette domain-containing protein [Clostridia bacterium]|nr:ATP-binding cassette domain-containing protein [Clostridia bacterium]